MAEFQTDRRKVNCEDYKPKRLEDLAREAGAAVEKSRQQAQESRQASSNLLDQMSRFKLTVGC